jgi:hypothetical protein
MAESIEIKLMEFIRNCDCGARKLNSSYGDVGFAPVSGLPRNEQKEFQSHVPFVCTKQIFFLYVYFCLEVETDAIFC